MARTEYATMAHGELDDRLAEARRELLNLRFQKATGQLDNTARIGAVRRDVARILTVLREQALAEEEELAVAGWDVPGTGDADEEEA